MRESAGAASVTAAVLDRIIEQAYKIGVGQVIDNSDKGAYNSRDSQLRLPRIQILFQNISFGRHIRSFSRWNFAISYFLFQIRCDPFKARLQRRYFGVRKTPQI